MINLPKQFLSLDMGNHSYKYIEAQLSDKLKIIRYGYCMQEQLFNSNTPAKTWRKVGSRFKNVVISFQHKSLITRELEIKDCDKYQLHNIVKEEFQQYQYDLKEEYDYDFIVQSYDEKTGIYMIKAAGISKKVNREYINKTFCLGMRPKAVDIQVNAIIRIIRKALNHSEKYTVQLPCLLIDLGYSNTTVAIINLNEIIALKSIAIGCSILNNLSDGYKIYLKEITLLINQIIDHYFYRYNNEELQQAYLYGGGSFINLIITQLNDQIPIRWNLLNHITQFLPDLPSDMDLNLYGNCLGSLYWIEEKYTNKKGSLT